MRVIARALIKSQSEHIEDFIQVLGEELSKHVDRVRSTPLAATTTAPRLLNIVADHLMKLDGAIEELRRSATRMSRVNPTMARTRALHRSLPGDGMRALLAPAI